MDPVFHTLHDFMLHTKAVTYMLMAAALAGIAWFWRFLCARDRD